MKKFALVPLCLFASCGLMLHAGGEAGTAEAPTRETKVYYLKEQDNNSTNKAWSISGRLAEKIRKSSLLRPTLMHEASDFRETFKDKKKEST